MCTRDSTDAKENIVGTCTTILFFLVYTSVRACTLVNVISICSIKIRKNYAKESSTSQSLMILSTVLLPSHFALVVTNFKNVQCDKNLFRI